MAEHETKPPNIPHSRFKEVAQKNKEMKQRISDLEKENIELKAQVSILERTILKLKVAK